MRNVQRAIRGRLDLEETPASELAPTREVEVDVSKSRRTSPATGVKPEDLPGPIALPGLPQIYVGAAIFALAILGVMFYMMIEPQASPAFLFLPMILLVFGVLGLFFGALSLDARKKGK